LKVNIDEALCVFQRTFVVYDKAFEQA
jgi:hypothetical protein